MVNGLNGLPALESLVSKKYEQIRSQYMTKDYWCKREEMKKNEMKGTKKENQLLKVSVEETIRPFPPLIRLEALPIA